MSKMYVLTRIANDDGSYDAAGDTVVFVTTQHVEDGVLLGASGSLLVHRVRHSPTGFSWGYSGSGPADLARSIVWDLLGHEPEPYVYQGVKNRLISSMPAVGGVITEQQVRDAIESIVCERARQVPQ